MGARLGMVRHAMRLDQRQFLEKMGLKGSSLNMLSQLERGQTRRLNVNLLLGETRLAREAGYSLTWLFFGEGPMQLRDALTSDQDLVREVARRRLLQPLEEAVETLRRRLDESGPAPMPAAPAPERRRMVPGYATISPAELPPDWDHHYVPIINRVAAGLGLDTTESESGPPGWADEYVSYEDPPAGAIALRVAGDSMAPRFASGDVVIVDPGRQAVPGEPAVVVYQQDREPLDARAVLKVWRPERRKVRLESINPAAPSIYIGREKVRHAFRVHAHLPRLLEIEEA